MEGVHSLMLGLHRRKFRKGRGLYRHTAKKQSSNPTLKFTSSTFTDAIRSFVFQLLVEGFFAAHLG